MIIKLILKNVPGFFKWLIPSALIAPIIALLVTNYAQDKEIDISGQNLRVIIFITLATIIIAIIWSLILTVYERKKQIHSTNLNKKQTKTFDSKIILPYNKITIGEYSMTDLCVDILANIQLINEVKPTTSQFLDRITIDNPYCPNCKKSLNILRGSWQIDGVQIGYKCKGCNTEIKKYRNDLIREVRAEVRKNYDSYWNKYTYEIKRITKGKPEKYAIP